MIFIKVYKGATANSNKTLRDNVSVNDLISRLNEEDLISQLSEFKSYEKVNLWDLGKRAKDHIDIGHTLVVVCRDNVYYGQIIGFIDDANGSIGDTVGWARQYQDPWSHVIILKDVVSVENDNIRNFIMGHNTYPYEILKNFLKIQGEEENLFIKLLNSPFPTKNNEIFKQVKPDLPPWLNGIINDVSKLKADATHQERGHESLIERFFENLGYERYRDIKFQRGRIDISILIENRPIVVIEVKKYWNLTVKKDNNPVEQAYKYALTTGARFVVISNGDYYAIFDRDEGRTYTDNLKGEFVLTSLKESDFNLIEFLKKENLRNQES